MTQMKCPRCGFSMFGIDSGSVCYNCGLSIPEVDDSYQPALEQKGKRLSEFICFTDNLKKRIKNDCFDYRDIGEFIKRVNETWGFKANSIPKNKLSHLLGKLSSFNQTGSRVSFLMSLIKKIDQIIEMVEE